MPLSRGTFFLKRAELSIFQICAELRVPFAETCRTMGTIMKKCDNIAKKSNGSVKVL